MSASYDAVIVGAGMVGATLACALAECGLRLAVIEAAPPGDAAGAATDPRVVAITRASQRILAHLGVWDAIAARRVSPFREMRVWDASGSGAIHFDAADLGEATLGYIVENNVIQAALWARMQQHANLTLVCPATVQTLHVAADHAHVGLEDGRSLTAALIVGADGGRSQVRQLAGIATQGWPYAQHAVVATVRPEHPHAETAWQRFLPAGPLAFLPLHDGRCSIVWSTTPEHATALLAMDTADFLCALEQASGGCLGRMLDGGPRQRFPLALQHAAHYIAPRVALIGDAAHLVHPLAGQGVNLGLLDAATLAEVLRAAREVQRDLGGSRALRRYERWRKGDNLLMLATVDGLQRLFGATAWPLRLARNTGLSLTHAATPIKHQLIRHAMGLSGDLPPLARGVARAATIS